LSQASAFSPLGEFMCVTVFLIQTDPSLALALTLVRCFSSFTIEIITTFIAAAPCFSQALTFPRFGEFMGAMVFLIRNNSCLSSIALHLFY
jgi:uncharacterized YccA/Bax inhibitor family protein